MKKLLIWIAAGIVLAAALLACQTTPTAPQPSSIQPKSDGFAPSGQGHTTLDLASDVRKRRSDPDLEG